VATVDKKFTYHALQLMTRGRVKLWYDDRAFDMRGCWLWPCHPGPHVKFHEWPTGRPWEHRYMAFTGPLAGVWLSQGLWPSEPQEVDTNTGKRWAGLMDEALARAHRGERLDWLGAVNLIERLLIEAASLRADHQPTTEPWLSDVTQRIARAQDGLDYAELATKHGMSLSTLQRRFARATGQSLHQFRLTARVTAARQMLGETDLSIKQIAQRLGYCDVFYFSRHFSRVVGVGPATYRRSRQG
jgi:AraC-like DNA-binding protein